MAWINESGIKRRALSISAVLQQRTGTESAPLNFGGCRIAIEKGKTYRSPESRKTVQTLFENLFSASAAQKWRDVKVAKGNLRKLGIDVQKWDTDGCVTGGRENAMEGER